MSRACATYVKGRVLKCSVDVRLLSQKSDDEGNFS